MMIKKKIKHIFEAIVFGVTIVGIFFLFTERERYQPKIAPFIGSIAEPFRERGVFINAKAYNSRESVNYLNKNLLKKGFQPIQITIQNNTEKTFVINDEGIRLPTTASGKVATKVSMEALPRSIVFKVASIFFWPFLIPSAVDSIITVKAHLAMKSDFKAKTIKENGEFVVPYSMVNRVVFVPIQHVGDEFTLHLHEWNSRYYHEIPVKINS